MTSTGYFKIVKAKLGTSLMVLPIPRDQVIIVDISGVVRKDVADGEMLLSKGHVLISAESFFLEPGAKITLNLHKGINLTIEYDEDDGAVHYLLMHIKDIVRQIEEQKLQ